MKIRSHWVCVVLLKSISIFGAWIIKHFLDVKVKVNWGYVEEGFLANSQKTGQYTVVTRGSFLNHALKVNYRE